MQIVELWRYLFGNKLYDYKLKQMPWFPIFSAVQLEKNQLIANCCKWSKSIQIYEITSVVYLF